MKLFASKDQSDKDVVYLCHMSFPGHLIHGIFTVGKFGIHWPGSFFYNSSISIYVYIFKI